MLAAAAWGIAYEGVRPSAWRRTVRAEFATVLRQAAADGLPSTIFTASLAGLGLVSQASYWLGLAGLGELTGSLLATVLLREIAPVLVGVILLGRSGLLTVTELGLLQTGGQIRTLVGQGIDPFTLLVMPRAIAFALAGFTLGVAFAVASLTVGFIVSASLGSTHETLFAFYDDALTALAARDVIIIPAKFLVIGFLVGLCSCLSGLAATPTDDIASLLPRGFARGMLTVMAADITFTVLA
jgi:phospholipid/cholesterol/gamma-HCH transport system permease protein